MAATPSAAIETTVTEDDTTTGEAASEAGASDAVMETNEGLSLIEQIRLKAQILRETKVIDKVSIASSNFDEYNAHDFITIEPDRQEDSLELTEHSANNSNNNNQIERRKWNSFKKSFLLSSSISDSPSSMGSNSSLLSIERIGSIKQIAGAGKSTSSSIYFDQEENNDEEGEHDNVHCTEPDSVATTVLGAGPTEAEAIAIENELFDTLSSSSTSSMSSSSFSSLIGNH